MILQTDCCIFTFQPFHYTAQTSWREGKRFQLICNATGGTQIAEDIDWFKDGNIIDTSRRRHKGLVILKYRSLEEGALISKLEIDHAEMDDAGTYVCRSSYNKLGDFMVNVLAGELGGGFCC